ncbi:MAG: ion transporter [Myxococcales bacterium]|nr:ion transporter [Myxococcales bacterium]
MTSVFYQDMMAPDADKMGGFSVTRTMTTSLLRRAPRRSPKLYSIVHHPVADLLVMVLIIASIALLAMEEYLPPFTGIYIVFVGDIITVFFGVELFLKFLVAKKKLRFFLRSWPDILAILPLFRPLRVFRLLRLFRLFQLGLLLDRRVALLSGVLRMNFYFLWGLLVMTALLIVGGAVGEFLLEYHQGGDFATVRKSLWWSTYALIAGEPVGSLPQTAIGRLLLVGLMLSGMGLFAVFTGMVSATMIDRLQRERQSGQLELDELEGHLVVCGWNQSAKPLLAELAVDTNFRGKPFVLVNELANPPPLMDIGVRSELIYHVRGDFTQLEILQRASIVKAQRAVVLADDSESHRRGDRDARSVLAALTIERLHPEIYCVVELMNEANKAHLAVAGVEAVIMRNDLSGRALASACRHPRLATVMMDLLTSRDGARLERVLGPVKAMSYGELLSRCKAEEGATVLGVETSHGKLYINPSAEYQVEPDDYLVMVRGGAEVPVSLRHRQDLDS